MISLGVLARARRRAESEPIWKLYRGLLVVTTAVVVFAGHQGGNLTHGSRYLLRNAPDFIKAYWANPSETAPRRIDEPEKYYLREIMPIFDAKCKRCHGETAHMSGYRLDRKEDAFAGGDSGKTAIAPGDPAGSHLLYVILLSRDHKKAMPPDGLNEVTSQETARIIDWIREGAPYVSDDQAFMPLVDE